MVEKYPACGRQVCGAKIIKYLLRKNGFSVSFPVSRIAL
jgi:hypothetical protein